MNIENSNISSIKIIIKWLVLSFLLITLPLAAEESRKSGKVLKGEILKSEILGRDVRYSLYLPPGYEENKKQKYPVVYLLHGMPGRPQDGDTDWIKYAKADRIVDQAINSGTIPPLILVMPDAGKTFYINNYSGEVRYEDMFIDELIPHIDASYRTHSSLKHRSIAGLSMGGFGALTLALRHPDLFSGCVALSAAIRSSEHIVDMKEMAYESFYGSILGPGLVGDDRVNDTWKSYSPLYLFKTLPSEQLKKTRWYIDIGDDDYLHEGNDQLHTLLRNRAVLHEYRVRDGSHNWSYWASGLEDGLIFLSKSY